MKKEWFEDWFDTAWYHTLYKNRNDLEAQAFMDTLIDYLQPLDDSRILDLACGKGRHSVYLSEKGYEVTGVDLSKESIAYAKRFERSNLHFDVLDMRQLYKADHFDYVFNLFTSFGYFQTEDEHVQALKNMGVGLRKNSTKSSRIVIDFLNAHSVRKQLVESELVVCSEVEFQIERTIDDQFVTKQIIVHDQGESYVFHERVRLFELTDFESMFAQAGLQLVKTFGDFSLGEYHESSDRLILIGALQ